MTVASLDNEPKTEVGFTETSASSDNGPVFDAKSTRRLLRKIDWHLLPFLALLYLLSFLDRSNIGNARLAGLEKSLGMSGLDYNNALAIFFPFYIVSEIPSNIILKKTKPSIWIPTLIVCWGTICTLMGVVQNYPGLLAARSFLGLAEGGLFPGVAFVISTWYKRTELGFRIALFFSAATVAGAFGGLLARAIMLMEGVAGLASWRWIFILEGILTVVVGVIAYFILYDTPATAKFLSPEETAEIQRRLNEDTTCLADEFAMGYVWDALTDWKIYVNSLITIGIFAPLYTFSAFLPTIIRDLGYKNGTAQLMSVPPYVAACAVCIILGYAADRAGQRGVFQIALTLVAMAGFSMLLAATDPNVKYGGTFLACIGVYANVPQCIVWTTNNVGGSTKRSIGIAMQVGMGNLGGVIASYLFLPKYAPRYIPGHSTSIAMNGMACIGSIVMTVYLRRENARRDREYKAPEAYTVEEMMAERTKGDNATYFRYIV